MLPHTLLSSWEVTGPKQGDTADTEHREVDMLFPFKKAVS